MESQTLQLDTLLTDEERAQFCGEMNEKDFKQVKNNNRSGRTFFATIATGNLRNLNILQRDEDFNPRNERQREIIKSGLIQIAEANEHIIYGSFAISAKDYPHIHLAITNGSKVARYRAIAKQYGNCWIKDLYGNKAESLDYIEKPKDGKWTEKGETIIECFGDRANIQDNRGKTERLIDFDEAVQNPRFKLDEWLLQNISAENRGEWDYYKKRYDAIITKRARQRGHVKVVYVEGGTSQGKTSGLLEKYGGKYSEEEICKYNFDSKAFPLNDYNGQKVLQLDELRPGMIPTRQLLQILDPAGYMFPIDKKNSSTKACFEEVYITSAFPLDDWFTSPEEEKGYESNAELKAQFVRRIEEHYTARNYQWFKDEEFEQYKAEVIEEAAVYRELKTLQKKSSERDKRRARIADMKKKVEELKNATASPKAAKTGEGGGSEPSSRI